MLHVTLLVHYVFSSHVKQRYRHLNGPWYSHKTNDSHLVGLPNAYFAPMSHKFCFIMPPIIWRFISWNIPVPLLWRVAAWQQLQRPIRMASRRWRGIRVMIIGRVGQARLEESFGQWPRSSHFYRDGRKVFNPVGPLKRWKSFGFSKCRAMKWLLITQT